MSGIRDPPENERTARGRNVERRVQGDGEREGGRERENNNNNNNDDDND